MHSTIPQILSTPGLAGATPGAGSPGRGMEGIMRKTWPHYEHTDGIHTMTWEDHSHIIMQRPHLDKNDYATFTQVYSPGGNLVGEGPLRMFDTQAVVRFALRCSATNGTTPVDWNARFI